VLLRGAVPAWARAPEQAARDLELLYTQTSSPFTEPRVRAASLAEEPGGLRLVMQQPSYFLALHKPYGQGIREPTAVQNIYAALQPGQFYLNSATRTLYYLPRAGEALSGAGAVTLLLPATEVLLQLEGAARVAVTHLTFAFSTWLAPNAIGYVSLQSGFRLTPASQAGTPDDDKTWEPIPAAVRLSGARDVALRNVTFAHLGATAVQAANASRRVEIINCTFVDVAGGGVLAGDAAAASCDAPPEARNGEITVADSLFDGVPAEFHDAAPLLAGFVDTTSFVGNTVLDNANTGISVGWGWSRDKCARRGCPCAAADGAPHQPAHPTLSTTTPLPRCRQECL